MIDPKRAFLSLDCETTGLDPESDRLIELALVAFKDGREAKHVRWWFDPQQAVSSGAQAVHGLTEADAKRLSDGAVFADLAKEVRRVLESGWPLLGHNLDFDLRMIDAEFARLGEPPVVKAVQVDTMDLAQEALPNMASHSLDAIARRFGIGRSSALHGALEDARLVGQIASPLMRLAEAGADVPDPKAPPVAAPAEADFVLPPEAALDAEDLVVFEP